MPRRDRRVPRCLAPCTRTLAVVLGLGAAQLLASGCAEMRQNMRNEFVSFRGAWFCSKAGCDEATMKRSTQAHRQGDVTVNHGALKSGAALVFKAGKTPQSFGATVRDCAGNTADVPQEDVRSPGSHGIPGQADSYVVRVDPSRLPGLTLGKGCDTWMVTTHATWDKGTWEQQAGIQQK